MSYYIDVVYIIHETNQLISFRLACDDDAKKIANVYVLFMCMSVIGTLYNQSITCVEPTIYTINSIDFIYWHKLACSKLNTVATKHMISLQLTGNNYIIRPLYFETNAHIPTRCDF